MRQIKDLPLLPELKDADFLVCQDSADNAYKKITLESLKQYIGQPSVPQLPEYLNLPLIETSGNTAFDTSGNNRNASYVNCTLNSEGVVLNGNSRVSLNSSHSALSNFSCLIEISTSGAVDQGIWEFRNTQNLSGGSYAPALIMNSSGNVRVYGWPSGSAFTTEAFNDGTFHKILTVVNPSTIKLFINKEKILDSSANAVQNFEGYFTIGSTRSNGNFTGSAKNFKIWNFELTDEQAIDFT